jgi:hypothetical protein
LPRKGRQASAGAHRNRKKNHKSQRPTQAVVTIIALLHPAKGVLQNWYKNNNF